MQEVGLEIAVKDEQKTTVIRVAGRIDIQSAPDLHATFKAIGRWPVVVDLDQVSYMDSSGVGVLVSGMRTAREKGLRFTLAGVNGRVRDVLEITKLDELFEIFPDTASAIQAVGS